MSELETFWTPWHALFYSGFAATAGWVVWITRRRILEGQPPSSAVPVGYRSSVLGLLVFAIGGVGDGIWHMLLGVETDVDALFSPTHILLVTGIILIVTGPIRSVGAQHVGRSLPRESAIVVGVAMTLAVLLISFFTMYAYAPSSGIFEVTFVAGGRGGFEAVFGVMMILVTTVTLLGPLLWLAARWHMPFGTYTAMLAVVGILMAAMLDELGEPWEIIPTVVAGIAADLAVRRFDPRPDRLVSWMAFGAAIPLVLWTAHFAMFATIRSLGWTPALWGGVPVLASMLGALLAYLVAYRPPGVYASDLVDGEQAFTTSYL